MFNSKQRTFIALSNLFLTRSKCHRIVSYSWVILDDETSVKGTSVCVSISQVCFTLTSGTYYSMCLYLHYVGKDIRWNFKENYQCDNSITLIVPRWISFFFSQVNKNFSFTTMCAFDEFIRCLIIKKGAIKRTRRKIARRKIYLDPRS